MEMAGAGSKAKAAVLPHPVARRRRRQPSRRRYRVEFSLDQEEFAELCAAAGAAGLALGAYAARATLGATRGSGGKGGGGSGGPLLRDALTALVRCEGQLRKIGVNLNQAVARLNATGRGGGDLVPYAAAITRIADRLEEWARQVRRAAIR
jgi:hypothetical protein